MIRISMILMLAASFILLIGCGGDDASKEGTLKISLTDAPAAAEFEAVNIEFDKIMINKAGAETKSFTAELKNEEDKGKEDSSSEETGDSESEKGGWIEMNTEGGLINLLELNNGKLYELGVEDLEVGQYNQIRIYVTKASVVIDGVEQEIKLASNTVKLVRPFTIEENITTELIVDFNALKSIKDVGDGFVMTPVIRVTEKKTTGAIKGVISGSGDSIVNITSFKNGETESYSGTVAEENGEFVLAFMEPGTYDIVIEANGFKEIRIDNIIVEAGVEKEIDEVVLEKLPEE